MLLDALGVEIAWWAFCTCLAVTALKEFDLKEALVLLAFFVATLPRGKFVNWRNIAILLIIVAGAGLLGFP